MSFVHVHLSYRIRVGDKLAVEFVHRFDRFVIVLKVHKTVSAQLPGIPIPHHFHIQRILSHALKCHHDETFGHVRFNLKNCKWF